MCPLSRLGTRDVAAAITMIALLAYRTFDPVEWSSLRAASYAKQQGAV